MFVTLGSIVLFFVDFHWCSWDVFTFAVSFPIVLSVFLVWVDINCNLTSINVYTSVVPDFVVVLPI